MPFDPNKPFEVLKEDDIGFDPSKPFEVVDESTSKKKVPLADSYKPVEPFSVVPKLLPGQVRQSHPSTALGVGLWNTAVIMPLLPLSALSSRTQRSVHLPVHLPVHQA